ncbi:hypothetical protein K2224_33895 (plasmid) [Streptomyces sp. BHT-5-2]|uniref:hypothetical protein n=1 Tax=Streptomyces sp. BHT-5-2 TaxID=2866715 RepID=UPI001C8E5BD4|nr:hypothetical protein [Streptomyces sp. BHT-5-2]QZL08140.1 hypothetical protein K2224_33895 [Streptomyces sp. BHT-5-2]
MVTFTQLLELDVNGLETFADRWGRVHKQIKEARETFHDDVVRKLHDDHWSGEGGRKAQEYCDRAQTGIEALDAEVKSLRRFLDEEADGASGTGGVKGFEGLQNQARALQQEAFGHGMTINDDGSIQYAVMYDPDAPDAQEILDESKRIATSLEERAKQVLGTASENDEWIALSLKVIFGTVQNFETEDRRNNVDEPTVHDHMVRNQLNNVGAMANARGWKNAAGLVQHYLDGSGKPVEVEPQQLMQDIPQFQRDFDKTMANDVSKRPDGPFTTEWQSTAPDPKDGEKSLDWYYGLNHFQYRVVGEKHGDQVTYHVDVQKRYDWGIPSEHRRTQTAFGGPFKMELEQADLAHLNTTGLARDFDVKGSSGQMQATL